MVRRILCVIVYDAESRGQVMQSCPRLTSLFYLLFVFKFVQVRSTTLLFVTYQFVINTPKNKGNLGNVYIDYTVVYNTNL